MTFFELLLYYLNSPDVLVKHVLQISILQPVRNANSEICTEQLQFSLSIERDPGNPPTRTTRAERSFCQDYALYYRQGHIFKRKLVRAFLSLESHSGDQHCA